MNHLRHIQGTAGQHDAKHVRIPGHQTANPDHASRQTERPIVQLFPIGPALEGRFPPEADVPENHFAELAEIPAAGNERIRSEENGSPTALLAGPTDSANDSREMSDDGRDGQNGKEVVPEAGRAKATHDLCQPPPPILVAVFESDSRGDQTEECYEQRRVL